MPKERANPDVQTTKRAIRAGRPAAASAGHVDARLLAAATHVFLKRGFEGTTCDQVAAMAGAGKGSLYARYANKEELFAAVVRRAVESAVHPTEEISADLPLSERLNIVGLDILYRALNPEALAMMRMVIATANRFPNLAQLADRIGWEGGVDRVATVVAARSHNTEEALARAKPAAAWFISLTFAPQQMRALLGDSQRALHAAAPARIHDAISMLSKSGWFDGWE